MNNDINKEQDMAVGFLMELARHPEQLNRYSCLSREEQQVISEGARKMETKDAMRNYVEQIWQLYGIILPQAILFPAAPAGCVL